MNLTINADLYDRVIAEYEETHSVRKTAANCHTSMVTAQRILITANLWSSKSSRQVQVLLDCGMTVDQIAEELHLTKDTVYTYMPYSRGMYGVDQTEDARYSKDYRKRMEAAKAGMIRGTEDNELYDDPTVFLDRANLRFDPATEEQFTDYASEDTDFGESYGEYGDVYALHLSLVGGFAYGADEDMDLKPGERAELLKLAKANNAISRDILVPGEINLHALHYAIQRLFGWQNSHLHNFSLPQTDFNKLTAGTFGGYKDLCGVLFRFPDSDMSDINWDDDYKTGVSVKTWLRKKYRAPFRQYSVGDSYLGNLWEIEVFRKRFPDFTDNIRLQEILDKVSIEQDWNYLSERLTIRELFTMGDEREEVRTWKGDVFSKLELLREDLKDAELCGALDKMKNAATQLRNWRQSFDQIDHLSWWHPDTFKKEIELAYKKSYEAVVEMHEKQIETWTIDCLAFLRDLNINLSPYFDTLYYLYDYGDNWCVKITVEEIYRKTKDGIFVNNDMCRVAEELEPILAEVDDKGKPVCMLSDGLSLVDDCGGIDGYLDMLRTINGEDKEEAANMRTWARGLGWTGRKIKPENTL